MRYQMTDKEQINKCQCSCDDCGAECEPFWKKENKEQMIIDGVDVSGCESYQIEANKLYPKAHYCGSIKNTFCEDNPNCHFKQLARKTQECEELEDFRTLVRELFTFGDSDVDDEHFIKYLKEDCKSSQEALDGYCRLTDITGIDYTVHGGADIEEIVKRVDSLKHECEELKKTLNSLTQTVVMPMSEPEVIDLTDRYHKALEEIEKEIRDFQCDNCEDYHCETCDMKDILIIINKVKEEI